MALKHKIWLFRHGETEWSKTGQHTGRSDIPLTDMGREQAEALGRRLAGRNFALVLSSPLSRALDTCKLAGFGDGVGITEDLLEWDYGAYDGRRTVDIQKDRPGWLVWKDGVIDGETVEQVGVRARRVIDRVTDVDGDVAMFSHGHMLRILGASWVGLPPVGGQLLALGTAALSVLGYEHDYRVIQIWNQDPHLVMEHSP
ncbi:MAG: histidine phosphatase family protein [Pseudomonadota bacterium]